MIPGFIWPSGASKSKEAILTKPWLPMGRPCPWIPDPLEGHVGLAGAYALKGSVSEAIREYREALRINPEAADVHNNVGVLLARQGRLPEAIAAYQEAIRLNPNLAEAYNNLGVIYWQKSSLSEARRAFQEALKRDPRHPAARANLDRLVSSPPGAGNRN